MQLYNRFYKDLGIRRVSEMNSSRRINKILNFTLPRGAVYHYLPEDTIHSGIPSDHIVVRTNDRLVMVDHVQALASSANEGRPRQSAIQGTKLIRDYHRRHRKLKLIRDLDLNLKDERTLLVVNYALLGQLYRYTQSAYSSFYEAINIETTLWDTIGRYVEKTDRQHFVKLTLPMPLPSLQAMRLVEDTIPKQYLNEFNEVERLMLVSLWRWLGEGERGPVAKLKKSVLSRVNLILQHESSWCVVNLGLLEGWKAGIEGDAELKADSLQKRFLQLMMALVESTSPVASQSESSADDDTANPEEPDQQKTNNRVDEPEDTPEDVVKELRETADSDDETLEEEIRVINDRELRQQENEEIGDIFTAPSEDPLKEGIMKEADVLAEEGLISAAEYRRFEALSERYKTIPDPRTGEGNIADASDIPPEDLIIDHPTKLPDSAGVVDKTMLETTLQEFDSRYTKNVLPKDINNMVLSIQKGGVAITDYDVEKVEDVANRYEMHRVKVTPVKGKPSTLHFKVPLIDDDGTFTSNNVRYRMRKQRAD